MQKPLAIVCGELSLLYVVIETTEGLILLTKSCNESCPEIPPTATSRDSITRETPTENFEYVDKCICRKAVKAHPSIQGVTCGTLQSKL